MLTLTSAKRTILLTVLINIITTFTLMTIFSSGIQMANAKKTVNCVVNKAVFFPFKSDGDYHGTIFANSGGNKKIGAIELIFTGTAPTSDSDRGNLTDVQFSATAVPNAFNFQSLQGQLDTSGPTTALSDFHVTTDTKDEIHFTGGSFINSTTITGNFSIDTGPHAGANGAYKVS